MALQEEHLRLDRARSNPAFQSWRLSRGGPDGSHGSLVLPKAVYVAREGSYDYLHTRISLLENHLKSDGRAMYIFLQGAGELQLARLETPGQVSTVTPCEASAVPTIVQHTRTWRCTADIHECMQGYHNSSMQVWTKQMHRHLLWTAQWHVFSAAVQTATHKTVYICCHQVMGTW